MAGLCVLTATALLDTLHSIAQYNSLPIRDFELFLSQTQLSITHFFGVALSASGFLLWLPTVANAEDRRMLLRELAAANKRALAATEGRREFILGLNHELRTPIYAITGTLELLHSKLNDETQLEHVISLRSATQSMVETLEETMDYVSLEMATFDLSPSKFFVKKRFEYVLGQIQEELDQRNVRVQFSINASIDERIRMDAIHLGRIWRAVLRTILQHCPANCDIEFEVDLQSNPNNDQMTKLVTSIRQPTTVLSVDSMRELYSICNGIEESENYNSRFLELAVARRISMLMGGELQYSYSRDQGIHFGFAAPCKMTKAEVASQSGMYEGYLDQCFKGLRVLLVEDDRVNQYVTERLLQNVGCTVEISADGQHGIAYALNKHYDVILLDCELPDISGIEVAKTIRDSERKQGTYTPLVALTAHDQGEMREQCARAGFDRFIGKPVSQKQLVETIADLTDRPIPKAPSEKLLSKKTSSNSSSNIYPI